MKKSTIIIIAAIFVASLVIVGVFGLKALVFQEIIYVDEIVLPDTIMGKQVKLLSDGSGYINIKYEKDLIVPISFECNPADASMRNDITMELLDQSGSEEAPCATLDDGGLLTFHKRGSATILIKSPDTKGVSVKLTIIAM